MRLISVFQCAVACFLCLNCLTASAWQAQDDSYSRNSATLILITHQDTHDNALTGIFKSASLGDKFDYNPVADYTLKVDYPRIRPATSSQDGVAAEERKNKINKLLSTRNIGKEIIAFWFNRDAATSVMNMNRIHQRGEYSVDDADVIQSQSIKRGDAALQEAGSSLINNSFIIAFDYDKLDYQSDHDGYYWAGAATAYVFQVDFTNEIQQEIYTNCWIEEGDDENTIIQKKAAFDRLVIPVKYIAITSCTETQSQNDYSGKQIYTKDEAFNALVTKSWKSILFNLEKEVDQLKVRTSLYDTHPIRAKIGKKEGLRAGSRYYAYEYRLDANNNISRKKTGVIRAETVIDNRQKASGNTEASKFYQIAGRHLQPGMLIEQHNDLGLGVFAGYKSGALEGINANIDLLLPAIWKEFYVGIDGSFFMKKDTDNKDSYTTIAANLQLGKGFHFARSCEFRLYFLGGIDYITNDDESSNENDKDMAYIAGAGARLTINIYYPVQLLAGAEANFLISEGDQYKFNRSAIGADRSGISFYGGLRICF